jgi:hypothetical protein
MASIVVQLLPWRELGKQERAAEDQMGGVTDRINNAAMLQKRGDETDLFTVGDKGFPRFSGPTKVSTSGPSIPHWFQAQEEADVIRCADSAIRRVTIDLSYCTLQTRSRMYS